jgi:O-antigen/teichoic acid export membrane protein
MTDPSETKLYRLLRWSERYAKTDMVYFASGGFWLIMNQIGLTLIGLGVSIVFGHFAAQDTYGNYRYVLILAGLFASLSLSGLGISVAQSIARGFDGALRQGFRLSVRWSLGLVVFSLMGAGYYWFFQQNAFVAISCLIIAISGPILNSASLYDSFLGGKKMFKRQTIYDFFDALIPALLLAAAIFLTSRAILLIIVYYAANTVAALFFYLKTQRLAQNDTTDPELFRYSAHLSTMNIISTIADKIDSIAVFTILGPAQLAIYTYATLMPEQIKAIAKLLTPLSLAKFTLRTIQEIRLSIWRRLAIFLLTFAAAIALYILLAPLLFKILFPVYLQSATYSQWYALSIIFAVSAIPLSSVFQAHKKTKELYISNNGAAVLLIILLPVLTYYYGIMGAVTAQLLYRAFGASITAWQFMRMKE